MLQAAANLAPRGVYVCGNTTSTAGLTVTLVRETGTGDFALEAGALVLAAPGPGPGGWGVILELKGVFRRLLLY